MIRTKNKDFISNGFVDTFSLFVRLSCRLPVSGLTTDDTAAGRHKPATIIAWFEI